jgi:hypothetical protein
MSIFRKYYRSLALRVASLISRILFLKNGGHRDALGSYISPFSNKVANDDDLHEKLVPIMQALTSQITGIPLVRFGSVFDGGYVLVDKDYKDSFLISAGISNNNDFEIDFANHGGTGIQIDYSVKEAPLAHPNLTFSPTRFVGEGNERESFDVSLDKIYLEHIDSTKFAASRNVLKMDIEGAEWEILETSSSIGEFDQILIELHYLERLAKPAFQKSYFNSLEKLLKEFFPVAIAGNNCCGFVTLGGFSVPRVIEMTLLNRKNYPEHGQMAPSGHQNLVTRNYPHRAPLELKNWSTR